EDGIRDRNVTGVQTCALPISKACGMSLILLCRFIPHSMVFLGLATTTEMGLRGNRVNAHMPLWIARNPYLPAVTQGWAPQANTRNFSDVRFAGCLGSPSETVD